MELGGHYASRTLFGSCIRDIIPKFRAKVCVHCSMSFNIPAVRVLPTVQRIWWRFRLGSFSKLMLDFKLCTDRSFSYFTATELIIPPANVV